MAVSTYGSSFSGVVARRVLRPELYTATSGM
jgi:hypothetical protein